MEALPRTPPRGCRTRWAWRRGNSPAITKSKRGDEVADSARTWTALAAILGSPAPPRPSSEPRPGGGWSLRANPSGDGDGSEVPKISACEIDGNCLRLNWPEEDADLVVARTVLGMLLGSPKSGPPPDEKGGRKYPAESKDASNFPLNEADEVCKDHSSMDGISTESIDLGELTDGDASFPSKAIAGRGTTRPGEGADSVLAWSALGMLLASPASGSLALKKGRRGPAKNLWRDGNNGVVGEDDLNNLLLYV